MRLNSPINGDDDDYVDSDTENEDEEEEIAKENLKKKTAKDESVYGSNSAFALDAIEFGGINRRSKELQEAAAQSASDSGSDSGKRNSIVKTESSKRSRDPGEEDIDGPERGSPLAAKKMRVQNSQKSSGDLSLSEENIKLLIQRSGGKINSKVLWTRFKKDAKQQYGDSHRQV